MKRFKVYFWKRVPVQIFREVKRENKSRLRDYMNVYLCKDLEEMYNLVDKLNGEKIPRDYGARTLNYTKKWYDNESGEFVKESPCNGWIVLCDEILSYNTIAHESSHAVIGYFARKLKGYKEIFDKIEGDEVVKENPINEELFAYMLGSLVEQILQNCVDKEEKE